MVVLRPGDNLPALVDQAVADGADALGVAGGDGSLAVAAAAALAHELPFVCVPAGIRNHFALDVGVDRADIVGSLDIFTHGVERRIDVAEVNGRLFVNNVSLGIYGDAVRRPAYRDAKARTLAQTAAQVLGPSEPAAGLEVMDDAAAPIATRRSCSSRTTRTRSSPRASRVRARPSTAGGSASSCSTGRPRASAGAGRGLRGSSR